MRCFRPDRCYNAVKLYVMGAMGEKFVQPPVLDYGRIYGSSNERMPMVFIQSPGADPQSDIQQLCDEKGFSAKFKFVALGQGQGPVAEAYLEQGASKGHWVLLQASLGRERLTPQRSRPPVARACLFPHVTTS